MDLAAMRQLFQCMGYSQLAATAVADKQVQGIDSLDELRILKDKQGDHKCL
jgi:hypothetical protein